MNLLNSWLFKHMVMKRVSCIVWDFDGTLWRDSELGEKIKQRYIYFINKRIKKPIASAEFDLASVKYGRWSKTVSKITNISEREVLDSVEQNLDISKYLRKDVELVKNLERLNIFRHLILTNSSKPRVESGLEKLGFRRKYGLSYYPFEIIIGRENLPFLKPHWNAFNSVTKYSQEPPFRHLIIGDSYDEDIIPARKLGFKAIHIDDAQRYLNI